VNFDPVGPVTPEFKTVKGVHFFVDLAVWLRSLGSATARLGSDFAGSV